MENKYKAGFVGVIGLPNAGKSTLVNAIVGERVGIITEKPQTTRNRVTGILSKESMQAVFVDSPGLVKADKGLNQFLQKEFEAVVDDSDILLVLLNPDCREFEKLKDLMDLAAGSKKKWMALITKSDLGIDHRVAILRQTLRDYEVPVKSVSSQKWPDDMLEEVSKFLGENLPQSPVPLYDPELYTTQNTRNICEEIIREKCFENLHQEVPYGLAVRVKKFDESREKLSKIYAEIYVNKPNHRSIVLGMGGDTIRSIGTDARKDIETLLGNKVFLELYAKVKKNWVQDKSSLEELGYGLK